MHSTIAIALVLTVPLAQAQQEEEAAPLPRALLIGDSISMGYTQPVIDLLADRVEVRRVAGNAGHTGRGIERLPGWLDAGNGRWDVIHFNWGLWDLCYRQKGSKVKGRDKVNGERTHTLEEYAANLERIVAVLSETGAELIFATTTPVPPGEPGRKVGDELRTNDVALRIMRAHGVAIDDLHSVVQGRMDELARAPGDVHFTREGSRILAEQVARSIERALRHRFSGKRTRGAPAPGWSPTRRVVYKNVGDVELGLHIFEPDFHAPGKLRAAIVLFFGGGWKGGQPKQFFPHCDYLASRGMVAISAEYRVEKTHGTTPFDCVQDGKSAIRWVRRHAAELGVDPERIAAGGGSAGGHVAAAVATVAGLDDDAQDPISPRPNALVLFNPVYDNGPGGYGHARLGERYLEISPLHSIRKGMPPAIVFLGTEDRLIPVATAEHFQRAMRELGIRSELRLYEGRPHGFFNHGRGSGLDYRATVHAMDEFLSSLDYLEGRPTIRVPAHK